MQEKTLKDFFWNIKLILDNIDCLPEKVKGELEKEYADLVKVNREILKVFMKEEDEKKKSNLELIEQVRTNSE